MVSCGYNTEDSSSSEMCCGFPQAAELARRGARPPKPPHVPSFNVLCLLSTTGAAVRTNWKTPWATGCWEPSTCEAVSEAAGHGVQHAPCGGITCQHHPIQVSVRARLRSNRSVRLRSNRSVPCLGQMEPRLSRPLHGGSQDWNRGQSAHQGCQPMSS